MKKLFLSQVVEDSSLDFISLDFVDSKDVLLIDDCESFAEFEIVLNLQSKVKLNYLLKIENAKFDCLSRKITVNLLSEYSDACLKISAKLQPSQTVFIKTNQVHLASNSKSDLIVKSVLEENSKINCENLIRIEKDLKNVIACENSKSLSLSKNVKVIFIPKLEVESKDVICKHGAAFSSLNEEQLFYLQSRGISLQQSKEMLTDSFLKI
ncbi:TPA: hypothetical protein DEO28_00495 [Candidatus Dependentiae bacterium]|nr:MAG: FeS assembly protein sufD [candidate division TM6 bacterium GW2011_GWE2_31_21]KKP54070.1 MAG: FeS assembly protein sufD [candidate division TM6 bacterium GW2011_GWF2_33_332]HBS48348.1 hypothetical protein [Candidatus Dependentiae bacterium]HBZ72978.1 hypothetical protein [Candidatus Dependentiae bacterium]